MTLLLFPDNCCSDEDELTKTFGQNITVKLDLWHAISRISREVKMKHLPRKRRLQFNKELSHAFRQPGDNGKERKCPTATSDIISKRLRNLKKNWEKIIPKKASKEIVNLLKHANKGCIR